MTKKNIYEILIKSIGLVLAYQLIFIVREFSGNLMMFSVQNQNLDDIPGKNIFIIYYVISIIVITLISYFLVYKTKFILTKINLKDTDETDLNLSINKKELFNIVLKTLGIIVVIWTMPSFILEVLKNFNSENQEINTFFVQKENLIYTTIKMTIGILTIIFSNKINDLTINEKE